MDATPIVIKFENSSYTSYMFGKKITTQHSIEKALKKTLAYVKSQS